MGGGSWGRRLWRAGAAALLALATTTCGGDGSDSHPPNGEPAARADRLKCKFHAGDPSSLTVGATIDDFGTTPDHVPIQYVFVLMMENRSFDNYFGAFREYLLRVPPGTGPRIAPTTPVRLDLPDPRTAAYDPKSGTGGVDVPPTAYDRRDPHDQDAQDAILVPKPGQDVAPFNPTVAGIPPSARCDKHYWHHANDVLDGYGRFTQHPDLDGAEQCVADTCHEWWCSHMQWDTGAMDGFFQSNDGYYEGGEPNTGFPPSAPLLSGDRAMIYYDWTDIPFYYWLADNFAIADHYFAPLLGPTYPNRDYLYGATSRGITSNASNSYGGSAATGLTWAGTLNDPPANYQHYNSIYDALHARTPDPVRFSHWVHSRYGSLGTLIARNEAFLGPLALGLHNDPRSANTACLNTDAPQSNATYIVGYGGGTATTGTFGFRRWLSVEDAALRGLGGDPAGWTPQCINQVNFIDPDTLQDVNGEDEHPPSPPQIGERFVFDVVDALMAAPEVWKRSVLLITWDEHGGFYDHVSPPEACHPDGIDPTGRWTGAYGGGDNTPWADAAHTIPRTDPAATKPPPDKTDQLYGGTFDRYGVRVPLLVISPWAKHRYVSHYTYDHTSILRFIESRFQVPSLTNRDANADPLFDLFDFSDAANKLRGNDISFGQEKMPPKDQDPFKPIATLDSAAKANQHCRDNFAPAPTETVAGALGATPYESWDWSPGKPPPCGYSSSGLAAPSKLAASCGGIYTLVDLGLAPVDHRIDTFNVNDQIDAGEPLPIALHLDAFGNIALNDDPVDLAGPQIWAAGAAPTVLPGVGGLLPAQVTGMNDVHYAVGTAVFCHEMNNATTAVAWSFEPGKDPVLLPLGSLAAGYGTKARALAISNQNHVVGISLRPTGALGFYYHAFLFDGAMHDLGVFPNGELSSARAVNAFDTVVGSAEADPAKTNHQHAAMWIQGEMIDLQPAFPCKSSYDCGDIACVNGTCDPSAILQSTAGAVDDGDIAAGDYGAKIASGEERFHAFASTYPAVTPVRLRAAWERPSPPNDTASYVPASHASAMTRDLQKRSVVVGNQVCETPDKSGPPVTAAVRWSLAPERTTRKTTYRDAFGVENLNLLVIDRGDVFLDDAVGVNGVGDVVATGYKRDASGAPGPKHLYLLRQTPAELPITPPPPIKARVLACLPKGFTASGPVPPFDTVHGCDIIATDGATVTVCSATGPIDPDGNFTAVDSQGVTIHGQLARDTNNMVAATMQNLLYSFGGVTDAPLTLTPN